MRFRNALIFTKHGFLRGGFEVTDGRFTALIPGECPGDVDLHGAKVIPGLVDTHSHGTVGADASDGDAQGLRRMLRYEAAAGVTSYLPTSMTLPYDELEAAFRVIREVHDAPLPGEARIMGINMEGPFFCEKRKGAQNPAYLRAPDIQAFLHLNEVSGGLVRTVAVAPELPGAIPFIREASKVCAVSIGHTDCDYDTARAAVEAGATRLTHLYNAMNGIHHRTPGPIAAGSESEQVYAELISDGIHIHPGAIRMAFKLFPGRICLISDSMRACGLPEGEFDLGGQTVLIRGRKCTLPDGTIAGAATNVYDDMRNAVAFGVPQEEAIRAATVVPARSLGIDHLVGAIAPGRYADFVVCDDDLAPQAVYMGGVEL